MTRDPAASQRIWQKIDAAESIILVTHVRPDGDAVGSVLGFAEALRGYGKEVHIAFEETLPVRFRFLEEKEKPTSISTSGLTVTVDCADQARMPKIFAKKKIDINIDHHATNTQFGDLNYVDAEAAATAEIISDLLLDWNIPITSSAASALLMGIITDTIGFRTPNTTPHTLRTAAKLSELGANLSEIYQRSLTDMTWEASLLWGFALNKLQKEGKIIYTVITCEDRKRSGFTDRDDADLTNFLSSIQDAEIAILFNQQSEKSVKVSWRSRSKVNVADLASQFGGGGHPAAAGAEMELSLQETQQKILEATKAYLLKIE
ncbi:MAG TPA: bifunctional oligoribonuclease/PAP phosphatase NrnA [Anaerolineaceae bacterium]|jgi:phosphoesterase RecJ-like protein|nr:bifunctional oligoribonuclease/PAP phosphatase NrnA [Anaerolineaceae bacterium]